jgi:hypothetical protein
LKRTFDIDVVECPNCNFPMDKPSASHDGLFDLYLRVALERGKQAPRALLRFYGV